MLLEHKTLVRCDKWDDDQVVYAQKKFDTRKLLSGSQISMVVKPYDTIFVEDNLLTTAGLDRLTKLIIGTGSTQAVTNTATRFGVGDGSGTAAVGDTDLSPVSHTLSHQWYQVMDATFPTQANGVLTFKASWATGDGNFPWTEYGVDVGTPTVSSGATVNALLLNHKTNVSLGTKVSGTWSLTMTITLS